MKILKFMLWAFLLFIMISFAFALDVSAADTTSVEESDLIFVIVKDKVDVYKELDPQAPMVYRLKKGDTLTINEGDSLVMLGHSDYWGKVQIKDTLSGYIERNSFEILNDK